MKTNKKYRKYTILTQTQLDELIGLNDYTCIEMYHESNAIPEYIYYCVNSILEKHIRNQALRACLYKHNTDGSFLVRFKNESLNVELFIYCTNEKCEVINRNNKPAIIKFVYNLTNEKINKIELNYIQNNIHHREFGPQTLEYLFLENTNDKFSLAKLIYRRHGQLYRPNGVTTLSFNRHLDISIINGTAKYYILCCHRIQVKNNTKYTINYKLINFNLANSIIINFLNHPNKQIHISNNNTCFYENKKFHRYKGPAASYNEDGIQKKFWFINGIMLPDTIIKLTNNIPNKPLTKANILEAMMFDRDYGNYLLNLSGKKII